MAGYLFFELIVSLIAFIIRGNGMSSDQSNLSSVDQYLNDHPGPSMSSVSQYILRQGDNAQLVPATYECLSFTGMFLKLFFKSSEDPIWLIIKNQSPSDLEREKERKSCFINAMQPLIKRDAEVELLRLKTLRKKYKWINERSKVSRYLIRKDLESVKEDLVLVDPMMANQVVIKEVKSEIKAGTSATGKITPIQLRNPATGKVELIKGNYQFIKRWVKEALVSEDLLPKVYNRSELSNMTSNSIQLAIIKLANKKGYRY